jgi:hypothetical protein
MDFGIGETIALSAALGAGSAAMKNQDPLRGALIGGVLGGATAGIGSAFGGAAAGEAATLGTEVANVGGAEAAKNVLGESAKNLLTEIPTETGGLFQNASGQLVDQSGQLIDQGAQEGIKQLAQNAAPSSAVPYDPMQASQEGFKYTGPQGIQTSANTTQFNPPAKGFFDQSTKTMLGDAPLSPFMKMAAPAVATTFTPMLNTSANKYGVPPPEHYTGPLSKFTYDPNTYQPDIVKPPNPAYKPSYAGYAGYTGYAEGGITQLATGGSAPLIGTPAQNTTMDSTVGNNAMFPMSEMSRSYYATPTQLPAGINSNNNPNPASPDGSMPGYGPRLDTNTGQMMNNFAEGGIAGLLKGRGDGMSDDIHATINDKQPARLADGEFVVPADVVSHLGNGSTDAGAKHLYSMMDKVRKARTGRKSQGKQISAGGYLPA